MRPLLGVVASVVAVLVLAGAGSAGDGEPAPQAQFTLEDARAFDDHPLYFAGDRVEGLPLVTVLRRSDTADFVSFVYGDCTPDDDMGCAPPLEIQVWPACRRHLALYGSSPSGPTIERTTVRDVPAAVLDGGTRLELQTGRSTIVVFGDSRGLLARVARLLRAIDGSVSVRHALPSPEPGALEGTLKC
jgi:hypothetical protein